MCKFFFSYHHKKSKKLLRDFLKHGNSENLEYGYGIAWPSDSGPRNGPSDSGPIWETHKCNCFHMNDPNSNKIINGINSTIIVSHIRNIYHENMTPAQITSELHPHNIHPFICGDSIFMHHGDLFMDYNNDLNAFQLNHDSIHFKSAISKLMTYIHPRYINRIKGETDSELMFYLLLSIQKSLIDSKDFVGEAALVQSVYILNELMQLVGISNSSNILISKGDFIIVAKIYKNNSKHDMKNPNFFYNEDERGGILFSNVKLVPNVHDVEKNILYLINKKTNNMCAYRL